MKLNSSNAVKEKQRSRIVLVVLSAALLACTAGCHPADEPSASTSVPPAPTQAERVNAIQSNPNLPPEAKAHITSEIEKKTPPTPAATHP